MPQKKRHITHMGVLWKYSICYFEIHSRDGILPGSLCFQCFGHTLIPFLHFVCLFGFFFLPKREGKNKGGSKISKSYCPSEMPSLILKVVRKRTLDVVTKNYFEKTQILFKILQVLLREKKNQLSL